MKGGHLWWLALFVLILWGGDRLGGLALRKVVERSGFRYARQYRGDARADVVLAGNSRGLGFYQPEIARLTGWTTYNMSYNGLSGELFESLLRDYLDQYPAPDELCVEVTMCYRSSGALVAGMTPFARPGSALDALIRRRSPATWWSARLSALFRHNGEPFQRALYYLNRSDEDWLLDRVISPELAARVSADSLNIRIDESGYRAMVAGIRAAQSREVKVRLIIAPYAPGYRVEGLEALKIRLKADVGIEVEDYAGALDDMRYFGDYNHINLAGAAAFMAMIFP
ncbi:MAG: hypothetical protein ACK4NS_02100 [Saprospiraceae bacterium]